MPNEINRIKQSSNQAIKQSSNQAIKQSSNQAIKQSSNQAIKQSSNYNLVPTPNQDNKHAKKASDGTMSFMVWSITGTALAACSGPIFGDGTSIGGGGGRSGGSGVFTIPESNSGPTPIAARLGSVPADGGVYINPAVAHRPQPQTGPGGADIQTGPGGVDIQDATIMFRQGDLATGGSGDVALSATSATERGVPMGEDRPDGFAGPDEEIDSVTFYYVSQANLERLFLSFDDPTYQVSADFDINLHVYDPADTDFETNIADATLREATARTVAVRFNADVDDPATAIALVGDAQTVTSIPEANGISRTKIADLMIVDIDETPLNTLQIVVTDNSLADDVAARIVAMFQLDRTTDGTAIYLRAGVNLDYETLPALPIRVQSVADSTIGVDVMVTVTNVQGEPGDFDDPVTAIAFEAGSTPVTMIAEDADTRTRTKIADLTFTDVDETPRNAVEIVVTDTSVSDSIISLFEIDGDELYLRAGTNLDHETVPALPIRVQSVADSTIGVNIPVAVTDVNDVAPMITSGATGGALVEGTPIPDSQVVYAAAGVFDVTPIVWSLEANIGDAGLFEINNTTGAVTFDEATTPDHAMKSTYTFTVVATSGSLTPARQSVTINVSDIPSVAPVINSGATGAALLENSPVAVGTAVYTATGRPELDTSSIIWSLAGTGDQTLFTIDDTTGVVTFAATTATTPDHEAKDTYSFTVIATDNLNSTLTSNQAVTIAVTDVNEAPTDITTSPTGALTAIYSVGNPIPAGTNGGLMITTLSTTDVDDGDTHTYTISAVATGTDPEAEAGAFMIRNDNELWLLPNPPTSVGAGDNFDIRITTRDSGGLTYSKDFTISRTVPNPPTLSAPIPADNDVTEDDTGDATVTGALTFDDPDAGQDKSNLRVYVAAGATATDASTEVAPGATGADTEVPVVGTYGTFTLTRTMAGDVTWTYTLNHTDADTQALGHSQNVTDQLAVIVYDIDGASSGVEIITIDVTGANDAPVLVDPVGATITDSETLNADSTVTGSLTGTFTVTDDMGDTHTFSASFGGVDGSALDTPENGFTHSIEGDYGMLFYDSGTGEYGYVPDEAEINVFDATDQETDDFEITATDDSIEASAEKTLVFTIDGANDAPTDITTSNIGQLTVAYTNPASVPTGPNGGLMITTLSTTDPDDTDGTGTYTYTRSGMHADEFMIRNDNELWLLPAPPSAVGAGDNFEITITTEDSGGLTYSKDFTIVRLNPPTLSVGTPVDNDVTEDDAGDATVTGALTFDDPDTGQDKSNIQVYVAVGTTATAASTQVALGAVGADTEVPVDGTYGTFQLTRTMAGDVTWTYTLDQSDADTQALGGGQEVTDQLAVIVFDTDRVSSGVEIITIDVTGANDAPTSSITSGAATVDVSKNEDDTLEIARLAFEDIDANDPNAGLTIRAFASGATTEPMTPAYDDTSPTPTAISAGETEVVGEYGTFTINRNNPLGLAGELTITYNLSEEDPAVMSLTGAFEKLTIYVNDGDENAVAQTFVATIVDDGNVPTLGLGLITEGNGLVTAGDTSKETLGRSLIFDDVDDGQDKSNLQVYVAAGQEASNASTEVMLGTTGTPFEVTVEGTYGSLDLTRTMAGDITLLYTLDHTDADTQALSHVARVTEFFTGIVYDDAGLRSSILSISIAIFGGNDTPTLDPVTGATITDNPASAEDSTVTTGSLTGMFTVTDVDIGDTHTFSASFGGVDGTAFGTPVSGFSHSIEGDYGMLFYNGETGAYEYVGDEGDINALNDGSSMTDTFEITVADNRGITVAATKSESDPKDLMFTIIGMNEPVPLFELPTGNPIAGTAGDDLTLSGTTSAELIRSGAGNDRIEGMGGNDVIISDTGTDSVILGHPTTQAGAETVVYHFESEDGGWVATDQSLTINNFEVGVDKLVLVDVNTNDPIVDLAAFIGDDDKPTVRFVVSSTEVIGIGIILGTSEIQLLLSNDNRPIIDTTGTNVNSIHEHVMAITDAVYQFELDDDAYSELAGIFGGGDFFDVGDASQLPEGLDIL